MGPSVGLNDKNPVSNYSTADDANDEVLLADATPTPTPTPATTAPDSTHGNSPEASLRRLYLTQGTPLGTPEEKDAAPEGQNLLESTEKAYKNGERLLGFLSKAVTPEKGAEVDEKIRGQIEGYLDDVAKLQDSARTDLANTQKQISDLYAKAQAGMPADEFEQQLGPLVEHEKQVSQAISKQEGLLEQLSFPCARMGQSLEKMHEAAEGFKQLQGAAGKALFGLDVLANLATLQKSDPGNWGKNIPEAVAISSSKLGLALELGKAGSKLSPTEAAMGLVKFGFEALGATDNPVYKTLNAASQALPIDVIGKAVTEICDQGDALAKIAQTGDWKSMENLNTKNLNGDYGLVMQGAAIIGDLAATGGRNIPSTGDSLGLANSLGIFGHTEISGADTGRTIDQKVDLINKLAGGANTEAADSNKIQNILHNSTPYQLAHVLGDGRVDTDNLLKSLRSDGQIDPVTDTVLDICSKAAFTQDPGVKRQLYKEAGDMIKRSYSSNRRNAVADFQRYAQTVGSLPPDIRHLMQYGN